MLINPINYLVAPPKRVLITDVNVTFVNYNNPNKICNVTINDSFVITFTGAEYDSLGQWSDSTLLTAVITKMGATPVTGSN
jgi:hypothetical protein